jgi:hypothetical protein
MGKPLFRSNGYYVDGITATPLRATRLTKIVYNIIVQNVSRGAPDIGDAA